VEPRSMLEKLILYFVYQTKGHITKTQLVKFLYLADLYSVKWTGKQLTDLNWYFYIHGPWHEDIDTALAHLSGQVVQTKQGQATLLQMGAEPLDLSTLEISQGLHFMLDNIRREWVGGSPEAQGKIDKLLEYVYSTAPMLAVKDKHEKSEKVRLNLALERELLLEELGA
jgi:uncharacterized phage-associated protein